MVKGKKFRTGKLSNNYLPDMLSCKNFQATNVSGLFIISEVFLFLRKETCCYHRGSYLSRTMRLVADMIIKQYSMVQLALVFGDQILRYDKQRVGVL